MTCQHCDRPVRARGLCNMHYQRVRSRQRAYGNWQPYLSSVGTTRRLRALVAIGWRLEDLGNEMGVNYTRIHQLTEGKRPSVHHKTAADVAALYDKLSMTPGPSRIARDRAHRKGWMPPLAWDDDDIDDPEAQPNPGHQEKLGFVERYTELRELGYRELQIAEKWGIRPDSLMRQLIRYDLPHSAELATAASSMKWQREKERAS